MTENPWPEIFDRTAPEVEMVPDSSDNVDNVHDAASGLSPRASFLVSSALSADVAAPVLNRPYLIKGWLDRGAFSVVYGPPNAGKSFLALDIAHHIAIGAPWANCKVNKSAVLYIASEGGQSFQNRVAALEGENARGLIILPCSIDLGIRSVRDGDSGSDIDALIAVIQVFSEKYGGFGLIIIDTLARSIGDGDENSGQDMGALIRNVDMLRARTDAHVMIVHHNGKNTERGARGHSSLRGAVDTEIEIADDDGVRTATVKKQRDMGRSNTFAYTLEEVVLGEDQDGDTVTSCRVEPAVALAEGRRDKGLKGNNKAVLEALEIFVGERGEPNPGGVGYPEIGKFKTVDVLEFKAFARRKLSGDEPKDKRRQVDLAINALRDKSLLQINDGRIWLLSRTIFDKTK